MHYQPSILTTPDQNAVIVYDDKIYQILNDDGEFEVKEILTFSDIGRAYSVKFLLTQNDIQEEC